MAWEVYQRSLEWEEVQRVPLNDSVMEKASVASNVAPTAPEMDRHTHYKMRGSMQRKCTKLSHLLTLRSQGTKAGCSTVCGECAQEIRWEDLNRDGR